MRKILSSLAVASLVLTLAACGSEEEVGVKSNVGATVGIAMPTTKNARWNADGKAMVEQFAAMGYNVNLKFAENNTENQLKQVKAMIDEGDKLLVISAIDGGSMTGVLAEAAKKNVKVIAYDRLLTNTNDVSYQATFDNHQVGVLQGKVLVERLGVDKGKDGPFRVELFAGSATDVNAKSFYDGSMEVLKPYIDSGQIVVPSGEIAFKKVTTKDYSDVLAQARMERLLKTYYKNRRVNGVLSPYDGMTIGIIEGLKKDGYGQGRRPLPWTSGQDAEIPSVQSIIAGEQTETIFKDTRELAKVAVQMGNALLTGSKPIVNDTVSFDNGVKIVPTYLLYPVAVDETNYEGLLVKSGFYTEKQLRS